MWTVWPRKCKMHVLNTFSSSALSKAINPSWHNMGSGSLPVSLIKQAGHLSRARSEGASASLSVTVLTHPLSFSVLNKTTTTTTIKCHLVQLSLYSPTAHAACQEEHWLSSPLWPLCFVLVLDTEPKAMCVLSTFSTELGLPWVL